MSVKKHSKRKDSEISENVLGGITTVPDDEELKYLEKIVLGTGKEIFEESSSDEDSYEEPQRKRNKDDTEVKQPAWVDEDDDVTFQNVIARQQRRCKPGNSGFKKYQDVMESKYKEVMGVPKWAEESSETKSPADDLLRTCGNFIKKPKFLSKGVLEIKKLRDLNSETHTEGPVINVVKFHPKSTVAMVGGASGIVSIFQVNGRQNTKLLTLQFQRYPISCGSFLKNGEEFLIGSQHYRYFYCHNLITGQSMKVDNSKMIGITNTKKFSVSPNDDIIAVCGNTGKIYLFAAASKEYIDFFQMNCNVNALEFNQNGSLLYSHGEEGEVYVWDMKTRKCVKKFFDDGCLTGTSIGVAKNDQLIACGSSSGVVNIYNSGNVHSNDGILPIKTIYNLVTPITSVQFNSSSEILAVASNYKDNSVKLVHCPSMTVFSNFPSFQSKIKRPMCIDFSPNSGFFAVGDNKGSAYLFRLKHFGNY